MQKLSHFITVEQVFDYMVEQEVSAWAERKIKELLMPQMKPTKLKVEKKAAVGVRRKRNV